MGENKELKGKNSEYKKIKNKKIKEKIGKKQGLAHGHGDSREPTRGRRASTRPSPTVGSRLM